MLEHESVNDTGPLDPDGRVILYGVGWWQYESMLAIRGDASGVRIAYLEGALEIVSPSKAHERIKKTIARLVEAYADETGISFEGYGSMTMRNAPKERGAEPDECYLVGGGQGEPNLVIGVVWTSGGLDKQRLYAGLGIAELWVWNDGKLDVYALRGEEYLAVPRSQLLPGLDLALLARFVDVPSQTVAVRAFRSALKAMG